MFQLSEDEYVSRRSQIVTASKNFRNIKYLPYAFTEHGVVMLSAVLKSDVAVAMNIFIVRAFIKMREYMNEYKDLAIQVGKIESQQKDDHELLKHVHTTIKHLIEKPDTPKKKIGFN